MIITVLSENTCKSGKAGCEHGLCIHIKTGGLSILFDMGQSSLFAENAEMLGIDLASVDFAVLSHGHYDHGGGLRRFLEINRKAPVYINEHAFMLHYNGTEKYIGLDVSLKDSGRIVFTHPPVSICRDITLYPPSEDITGKFSSAGLTFFENGTFYDEDFRHEQYLEIMENGKKILFSGCSHRGITNIVKTHRPDCLIGGFHLSKHPLDSKLCEYAEFLDSYKTVYYTCHCTGTMQYEFLKTKMRNLNYLSCSDTVEI